MIRTIAVGDANWTNILDAVKNDDEVVITEDGEPIARVIPIENPLRGPMYGTITFHGDIVGPLDEGAASRKAATRTLQELRGSVTIHGDIVNPIED